MKKKPTPTPPPKEVKPRHKKPGPDSIFEVVHETRKLVRLLSQQQGSQISPQIGQQLDRLIKQGDAIMASLQEVKDKITQVAADIVSEKKEVQDAITELKKEIQALKDQIAAGNPVTAADLDELVTALGAIDTSVKDISEPSV